MIFDLGGKIRERPAAAAVMASSSRAKSERCRRVSRESSVSTVDFSDESSSSGPEEDSLSSEFSTDSDEALKTCVFGNFFAFLFFHP